MMLKGWSSATDTKEKKANAQNQLAINHLRLTEVGFVVSVWSCGTSIELYRCLEKLYSINSAVKLSTASNKAFSCPFSGRSHTNNHDMFSTVCPASQRMPSKRSSRSTQWYNSHWEEKQVVIRDLNMHIKQYVDRGVGIYLANVPGLDLLQFQQQLFVAASFQLLYESPAISRLEEECKNMSTTRKHALSNSNTPNAQKSCLLTASVGVFFNLLLSTFMVTNFYTRFLQRTHQIIREKLSHMNSE